MAIDLMQLLELPTSPVRRLVRQQIGPAQEGIGSDSSVGRRKDRRPRTLSHGQISERKI